MAGRSPREGALIRKLRIILRVKEVFGERANIAVLFFWNSNVVSSVSGKNKFILF